VNQPIGAWAPLYCIYVFFLHVAIIDSKRNVITQSNEDYVRHGGQLRRIHVRLRHVGGIGTYKVFICHKISNIQHKFLGSRIRRNHSQSIDRTHDMCQKFVGEGLPMMPHIANDIEARIFMEICRKKEWVAK